MVQALQWVQEDRKVLEFLEVLSFQLIQLVLANLSVLVLHLLLSVHHLPSFLELQGHPPGL
jgi:hypothetical protein